jgi:hypothetical protein
MLDVHRSLMMPALQLYHIESMEKVSRGEAAGKVEAKSLAGPVATTSRRAIW